MLSQAGYSKGLEMPPRKKKPEITGRRESNEINWDDLETQKGIDWFRNMARDMYSKTRSFAEIDDIASEARERARSHENRGDIRNPAALFRRIIHDMGIDLWRRAKSNRTISESGWNSEDEESGLYARTASVADASREGQREARADVQRLMAAANLPAQQRRMIELHYLEVKTVAEVAEILGLPEKTVKNQMAKAMRALRAITETED